MKLLVAYRLNNLPENFLKFRENIDDKIQTSIVVFDCRPCEETFQCEDEVIKLSFEDSLDLLPRVVETSVSKDCDFFTIVEESVNLKYKHSLSKLLPADFLNDPNIGATYCDFEVNHNNICEPSYHHIFPQNLLNEPLVVYKTSIFSSPNMDIKDLGRHFIIKYIPHILATVNT